MEREGHQVNLVERRMLVRGRQGPAPAMPVASMPARTKLMPRSQVSISQQLVSAS
jgi:hypothetical protein